MEAGGWVWAAMCLSGRSHRREGMGGGRRWNRLGGGKEGSHGGGQGLCELTQLGGKWRHWQTSVTPLSINPILVHIHNDYSRFILTNQSHFLTPTAGVPL